MHVLKRAVGLSFMAVALMAMTVGDNASGDLAATTAEAGYIISPAFEVAPAVARGECTVDCYLPHTCNWCEHKAPEVIGEGSHLEEDGAHSECYEGQYEWDTQSCPSKHAICLGGVALQEVVDGLDGSDYAGVWGLMDTGGGISVEWDEGVVALHNCAGKTIATVALSSAELSALAIAFVQ